MAKVTPIASVRTILDAANPAAASAGVLALLANSYPRIYHVEAYGAKGDGRIITDAAITSGSAILTSASGAFTSADVGKWIMVQQAGAASADLRTTVASVTNATTIVLSATAGTTVASAGRVFLGTESTAGIQAAIDACEAQGGGVVYAPRGIYFIDGVFRAAHAEAETNTAQIVFPSKGLGSGACTIEVIGEGSAGLITDAYATSIQYTLSSNGTCFYKTRLSSGYYDGMFSTEVSASYFQGQNYNTIIIRGIAFRNRSQTGITQVDGKGILVDATACGLFAARDCSFSSESAPATVIEQTSTAVRLPRQGNYCLSELRNVVIQGMGAGVQTQEHAFLDNVAIDGCYTGIVSTGGHHGQNWNKVGVWRCARPIFFSGQSRVIGNVAMERWEGSGRWYDLLAEDIVGNTVEIRGRLQVLVGVAGGTYGAPTVASNLNRTKMQIFDINEGANIA